jgi:hypothetical protein
MPRASNRATRKRKTKINLEHHFATHERRKAAINVELDRAASSSQHISTSTKPDNKTQQTIGP